MINQSQVVPKVAQIKQMAFKKEQIILASKKVYISYTNEISISYLYTGAKWNRKTFIVDNIYIYIYILNGYLLGHNLRKHNMM